MSLRARARPRLPGAEGGPHRAVSAGLVGGAASCEMHVAERTEEYRPSVRKSRACSPAPGPAATTARSRRSSALMGATSEAKSPAVCATRPLAARGSPKPRPQPILGL